jgi:surfactin synthase thioesterase subunit
MDAIKSFFKAEYSTDGPIEASSRLREDLWLDDLALEDLGTHLAQRVAGLRIGPSSWETISTVGDLLKVVEGAMPKDAPVPVVNADTMKLILTPVIDKQKAPRQMAASAIPMISFYHAGGMVAQVRAVSKQIDDASGALAVNPIWCELPGRGVRAKEPFSHSAQETATEFAATVATSVLGGDKAKPFFVFGHSCGTLHAFEVARELERMGFVPKALILINRQAPQIPMDKPEDVFPDDDEAFVSKMSAEYGQKTLLDMWKTSREIVIRSLPPTKNDMKILTSYRLADPERKLRAPIICATASGDRASNGEANCLPWKDVSSHASFAFKVFQGGHFFYQEDSKTFWTWVFQNVSKLG